MLKLIKGIIVFRIFTENKGPHFIIVKIGEPKKEHHFGRVEFYKKIGTDTFYIKVEDVIKNPSDWYNKLIKGKFDRMKIGNHHNVEILSENKIRIINEELKIVKEIELKNIEWNFIDRGRFLGIKGEVKGEIIEEGQSRTKIGIVTDGDGNIFMGIFGKGEIIDINLNEDMLVFKYKHSEKEIRTHIVFFKHPIELVKEIKSENNGWFVNIEAVIAWFNVESNIKGAISEKIAWFISEIKRFNPIGGIALGKRSKESSDVKIILNGKLSPEEVKSRDITGLSKEEIKNFFLKELGRGKKDEHNTAIKQIMNDFEKEIFKNSEAGIAIIIGFDRNKIDPNSKYVEIEVLIVKVYSDEKTKIISKSHSNPHLRRITLSLFGFAL